MATSGHFDNSSSFQVAEDSRAQQAGQACSYHVHTRARQEGHDEGGARQVFTQIRAPFNQVLQEASFLNSVVRAHT